MGVKYSVIMVLSFIYGGFLLTIYSLTMYTVIMKEEVPRPFGMLVYRDVPGAHIIPRIAENTITNVSTYSETINETSRKVNNTNQRNPPLQRKTDPWEAATSPYMLLSLIGGLICITNGLAIRQLTHEREVRRVRQNLKELLLNPEEKRVIEELQKSGGEQTQKNLTELTGFSRVKTHRIIQRLEEKKLVRKIPNGQTNRIILEKEVE